LHLFSRPNIKSNYKFSKSNIAAFAAVFGMVGLYLILKTLAAPSVIYGQVNANNAESFVPNEVLIKVKDSYKPSLKPSLKPTDTGLEELNKSNKALGVNKIEQLARPNKKSNSSAPVFNWYLVSFQSSSNKKYITKSDKAQYASLKFKINSYINNPSVEYAQPNFKHTISIVPNDPYYSSTGSWGQSYDDLWGIKKINSAQAWDLTTGSTGVVVADIDTGVDRNHEDLKNNMWVNAAEIPSNGIDDDQNGYVDDYYGWDFHNKDSDPMDDHGHGSHTVGTIAGTGNNGLGVVGVNWKSKVMALKFLDGGGSGDGSDAVRALQYAADMGARVSSNSWGCACSDPATEDAIKYEHDKNMVTVVAAGNSNADALTFSPASADYAMTVAASDWNDAKASFSNYGEKIDVTAPGVNILSVKAAVNNMCSSGNTVGTNYCVVSGTSMATPHVAGLASLILAKNPNLSNEEVRQIIRTQADDLGATGKDSSFGYGRINASNSVSNAVSVLAPIIESPRSRSVIYGSSVPIVGKVPGPNFVSYKIELGAGRAPTSWQTAYTSSAQPSNSSTLTNLNTSMFNDGKYTIRLSGTNSDGKTYQFQVADIEIDNLDAAITSPLELAKANSVINVTGTALAKNGNVLSNYKLEWGAGSSPTSWSSAGITLANNGTLAVSNGQLGTWDTNGLVSNQQYSLRLTVNLSTNTSYSVTSTVTLDSDLVPGWPKSLAYSPYCGKCQTTVTYADLDGDSVKEVIVTSSSSQLNVFRKDGSNFPGFPVYIGSSSYNSVQSPPTVTDLDNDGKPELIVNLNNITDSAVLSPFSQIYIVKNNGQYYSGWPVNNIIYNDPQDGDPTPIAADLNADGQKEIIAYSVYEGYNYLHAYHLNGTELSGFPKQLPFSSTPSQIIGNSKLTIADLDNDGYPEVVMPYHSKVYVFDHNGNLMSGWPFNPGLVNGVNPYFYNAAIGDIDGDGIKEVSVLGNTTGTSGGVLYTLHKDGSVLSGWPPAWQQNGGTVGSAVEPWNSPSIADYNGDGKDDVFAAANLMSVFNYQGNLLNSNSSSIYQGGHTGVSAMDVDGDGKLDYATPRYNWLYLGDGNNIKWQRSVFSNANSYSLNQVPVLSDIDKNGRVEYGAGEEYSSGGSPQVSAYLWELPFTTSSVNDWPTLGHDNLNTGNLKGPDFRSNSGDITPPDVSISAPVSGSTVSGPVIINVSASDNSAVSRVEFYIDGALISTDATAPYSYTWDSTSASNGVHIITVKAFDASSNSNTSSVNVNVSNADITPPSTPTGLSASAAAYNSVNLSWSASNDNVGVAGYYIVRNGTTIAQTTGTVTTYNDITVNASTTYSYKVMAYDAKGNLSTLSAAANVTTPAAPDTTAPTAPTSLTALAVSSSQINLSWGASTDNTGISAYDIYRNGTKIASSTTTSFGDTGLSANTTYSYFVKARDAAGNISPPSNNASATTQAPPVTTGKLNGTIFSSAGGVISGATISVMFGGSNHNYSSNSSGFYSITQIPAGTYTVKYSQPKYSAQTLSVSIVAGQTLTKDVTLQKNK
jgi:subtilisin family serine protease/chitodextrinase